MATADGSACKLAQETCLKKSITTHPIGLGATAQAQFLNNALFWNSQSSFFKRSVRCNPQ
jgi:hypothetical protein